jgi:CheY-like chemotaxis protein
MRPLALIVDDCAPVRKGLAILLQGWGMDTVAVENSTLALAHAQAHHPQLIITDMVRPDGNGLEFIRQVRALPGLSAVPIIFSSGGGSTEENCRQAEQMGATVLPKPVNLEALYVVVQRITGSSLDLGQVCLDSAEEHMDDYVKHSMCDGAEDYLVNARLHLDVATRNGKDTSKHYERLRELEQASKRARMNKPE